MAAQTHSQSLAARFFGSSAWLIVGQLIQYVIRLGSTILVTRMVAPDAYGLMAVLVSLQTIIFLMSDLGLHSVMMRSKNADDPVFLSTIFVISAAQGITVSLLLLIISLVLAHLQATFPLPGVYGDLRLPLVIVIGALAVFLTGLTSVKWRLKERQLKVGAVVRLEIAAQAISFTVTFATAFLGWQVYALLTGFVVSAAARVALSYVALSGPKFGLTFSLRYFSEIFDYGRWVLISSTLSGLAGQGEKLFFGGVLSTGVLGLLSIGSIWITALQTLMNTLIRRAAFPALGEINRSDPAGIQPAYRRMRLGLDLAAIAAFVIIFLGADFAVDLIYREEFSGVARFAKLLSLGILMTPFMLTRVVLLAAGDSRRQLGYVAYHCAAVIIGVPLIFHLFGIDAALAFAALSPAAGLIYLWNSVRRYMTVNYWIECRTIAVALAAVIWIFITR